MKHRVTDSPSSQLSAIRLQSLSAACVLVFSAGVASATPPLAESIGLQLIATTNSEFTALDLNSDPVSRIITEGRSGFINASRQSAFRAAATTEGDFHILRAEPTGVGTATPLTLIASTDPLLLNSIVPGHSGFRFIALTCTPSINDDGDVAFSAKAVNESSQHAELICLYHNGALQTIAFAGDLAPSTDPGFTTNVYFTGGMYEECPDDYLSGNSHTKVALTSHGEIFFHASTSEVSRTWVPRMSDDFETECEPEEPTTQTVPGDGLYVYRSGIVYAVAARYETAPGYPDESFLEAPIDNRFSVANQWNGTLNGKIGFGKGLPPKERNSQSTSDLWFGTNAAVEILAAGINDCAARPELDIPPFLIEPLITGTTNAVEPPVIFGSTTPLYLYWAILDGSWSVSSLLPTSFSSDDINYQWTPLSMLAAPYARGIHSDILNSNHYPDVIYPLQLESGSEIRVSWILAQPTGADSICQTLFTTVSSTDFPTLPSRYNPSCGCAGSLSALSSPEFGGGWNMIIEGPGINGYRGTIADGSPAMANTGQLAMVMTLFHTEEAPQQALATRNIRSYDHRSYVDLIAGPSSVYNVSGLHGTQFYVDLPDGTGNFDQKLVEIIGMQLGTSFPEKSYMPDGKGAGLCLINDCGYVPIQLSLHEVPLSSMDPDIYHTSLFWYKLRPIGDANGDRVVNLFDYLDFLDGYSVGAPCSDWNQDGVIDFFDVLDFLDDFAIGSVISEICP